MSAQACKRRRTQARNGYKHMSPMQRPHYSKKSAEASAKATARAIANARKGLK